MKRSILAVIAGIAFVIVVTTLVDIAFHSIGILPPIGVPMDAGVASVALAYRVVIGVMGACLTAKLAPSDPMKHAITLGYVGMILGILGVVTTWNKGLAPVWYPIAVAALALPQSWLGGRIYELRSGRAVRSAG